MSRDSSGAASANATSTGVVAARRSLVGRLAVSFLLPVLLILLLVALLAWLKAKGRIEFPDSYRVTDAHPLPSGWRNAYWLNMHETFSLP